MAPSAEDDEAALSSMLTADHRAGAPHALGEGAVAYGVAVEGSVCPHCCLVLPMTCFMLKGATVHGGQ